VKPKFCPLPRAVPEYRSPAADETMGPIPGFPSPCLDHQVPIDIYRNEVLSAPKASVRPPRDRGFPFVPSVVAKRAASRVKTCWRCLSYQCGFKIVAAAGNLSPLRSPPPRPRSFHHPWGIGALLWGPAFKPVSAQGRPDGPDPWGWGL
jgi:hypothetical protein